MKIRIVHVDGSFPNLALMSLSAWHKAQGDDVTFTRDLVMSDSGWPDRVYASAIFEDSQPKIDYLREQFGDILIAGGTHLGKEAHAKVPIEDYVPSQFTELDYSAYPEYKNSIGFTHRGCRLKCEFCCVPWKEGRPYSVGDAYAIWRGGDHPRHLHLLDNDFFGNPEWRTVARQVIDGKFKICVNQGINIRVINDEAAEAIAAMRPYDTKFKKQRVYTAWDQIGHERAFFRGVDRLERYGVKPWKIMSYMLVGFDPEETVERLVYRYDKMRARGVDVYVMAHNRWRGTEHDARYRIVKRFQRWANGHASGPFAEYNANLKLNRTTGRN